jgi:hypothetical protein
MICKIIVYLSCILPVLFPPAIYAQEKDNLAETNDTAENIFKDFPRQKCSDDNDCKGVFGTIEGKCIKCPGMKMVLGKRVFKASENFGFCEQKHMVDINMSRHPADDRQEWGSTCHCLAEFDGKEFKTVSANAKQYLDIWKEFAISSQGISEEYFKKHISLLKAYESQNMYGTFFIVDYEYTLDWAKVILCDSFIV